MHTAALRSVSLIAHGIKLATLRTLDDLLGDDAVRLVFAPPWRACDPHQSGRVS
jgi:hypothetical protein